MPLDILVYHLVPCRYEETVEIHFNLEVLCPGARSCIFFRDFNFVQEIIILLFFYSCFSNTFFIRMSVLLLMIIFEMVAFTGRNEM